MSENKGEELKISSSSPYQASLKGNTDVTHTRGVIDSLSSQENNQIKSTSETSVESRQTSNASSTTSDPSPTTSNPSSSKNSKWCSIRSWLRFCELECLLMLLGIVTALMGTFQDNVIYNQICIHQMDKEYKKCYNFENTPNISRHELKMHSVLVAATSHKTAILVIKLPIEFVSSLFLCSWSDSYGRKFPIIAAILSANLDLITYFFHNSDFDVFMAALYTNTVLSSLFGGTVCVFAMSYSYGTDHSSMRFRTFKFTTMDVSFVAGTIVGTMVLRNFPSESGMLHNFLLSLSVNVFSAIWIFLVFEDKNFEGKDVTTFEKFTHLSSTSNAGSNFKVLSKWRCDCEAEQLRMIVFSIMPAYISYGLAEGTYLSNGKHASYFSDFQKYNLTMNIFGLYSCVLVLVCMAFFQFLVMLEDSTIGLIGFFSLYIPGFVTAFVSELYTLLIAGMLAAVKSFSSIALRSTVSKIADEHETGRTFLFVSLSEVTALYAGWIWHAKRYFILGQRTYPDFSYLLECTIIVIPFCVFMFQAISIHTKELFRKCYRTVQVPPETIQPEPEDTLEEFDA